MYTTSCCHVFGALLAEVEKEMLLLGETKVVVGLFIVQNLKNVYNV